MGQPEEAMCAHGPIVIDSSILTLTMMEWPDAGGAGHMQVSSTAGSIPRINSTGEVRHSAQASSDVEGELLALSLRAAPDIHFKPLRAHVYRAVFETCMTRQIWVCAPLCPSPMSE